MEPRIKAQAGYGWVPIGELENVITYGEGKAMTSAGYAGEGSDSVGLLIVTEASKAKNIPSFGRLAEEMARDGFNLNSDGGQVVHNADIVFQFRNVKGLDVLLFSILKIRGLMVAAGHENQEWPSIDTIGELQRAIEEREGGTEQ